METLNPKEYEILVVDDSPEIVDLVVNAFKAQSEFVIDKALDGEEALAKINRKHYDLILLDVVMPGMDGFAVCQKIKQDDKLVNIPVIFLSGNKNHADIIRGFELGAVDYLSKPFHKQELLVRVRTHIDLIWKSRKLEAIQNFIKPYIPPVIFDKALELLNNQNIEFLEEMKEVTILFGDIVSFTETVEVLNPLDALSLLNIAIGVAADAIRRNHGYIDKFLGDGLMALFQDPYSAVLASVEIQSLFYQLNEMRTLTGKKPLRYRLGLNTGFVAMGNVGKKERREWTAIGDVVNTASRLERNCQAGKVLISESTYRKVKDRITVWKKGKLKAKGKKEAIPVFYVSAIENTRNDKKFTMEVPEIE